MKHVNSTPSHSHKAMSLIQFPAIKQIVKNSHHQSEKQKISVFANKQIFGDYRALILVKEIAAVINR